MGFGNAQLSGVAAEALLVPKGFIDAPLVDRISDLEAPCRTQCKSIPASRANGEASWTSMQ